jgi:hypothetical protein
MQSKIMMQNALVLIAVLYGRAVSAGASASQERDGPWQTQQRDYQRHSQPSKQLPS